MDDPTETNGSTAEAPVRERNKVTERLNAQAKLGGIQLGPPIDPDVAEYTVVIFGVPRGGTTMVAGVAEKIGLNIGQDLGHNLEDADFDRTSQEHMQAAIAERNSRLPVWGWKYPSASVYLSALMPYLRNPRFVVVWRDPLTAAIRAVEDIKQKGLKHEAETRRAMQAVEAMVARQMNNVALLKQAGVPALLVSYEKAVRRPHDFITQLAGFMGMPVPEDMAETVAFMEPESYK